jgi:hypothetical protein
MRPKRQRRLSSRAPKKLDGCSHLFSKKDKMRPVILYRGDEFAEEELNPAISAGFFCTNSRMEVPSKSLVIPRYSCLPFYKELENDLAFNGSKLLNSHEQHRYIADMQNWYEDLKDYTPKTWRDVTSVPLTERGPFVVKGETNSKKNLWEHSYVRRRQGLSRKSDRKPPRRFLDKDAEYLHKKMGTVR